MIVSAELLHVHFVFRIYFKYNDFLIIGHSSVRQHSFFSKFDTPNDLILIITLGDLTTLYSDLTAVHYTPHTIT